MEMFDPEEAAEDGFIYVDGSDSDKDHNSGLEGAGASTSVNEVEKKIRKRHSRL